MTELLTLSEIADRFAAAANGDQDDASLFLRQLRHLDTHGLIKADPVPRDKRGTAQFSQREMLIARLLVAASNQNMTRADLGWLRSVIVNGRTAVLPTEANFEINLDENVRRISKGGENWLIELTSSRGATPDERTTSSYWVKALSDGRRLRFGEHYPDPLQPGIVLGNGRAVEFVAYLHVTNLLRPLIKAEA